MEKSIYLNYLLVALITALVCFVIAVLLFYHFVNKQIKKFSSKLTEGNSNLGEDLLKMMKKMNQSNFMSPQLNKNFPLDELTKIEKILKENKEKPEGKNKKT